jgi:hypothetical protein
MSSVVRTIKKVVRGVFGGGRREAPPNIRVQRAARLPDARDPKVRAERRRQRQEELARAGRASTILTGAPTPQQLSGGGGIGGAPAPGIMRNRETLG